MYHSFSWQEGHACKHQYPVLRNDQEYNCPRNLPKNQIVDHYFHTNRNIKCLNFFFGMNFQDGSCFVQLSPNGFYCFPIVLQKAKIVFVVGDKHKTSRNKKQTANCQKKFMALYKLCNYFQSENIQVKQKIYGLSIQNRHDSPQNYQNAKERCTKKNRINQNKNSKDIQYRENNENIQDTGKIFQFLLVLSYGTLAPLFNSCTFPDDIHTYSSCVVANACAYPPQAKGLTTSKNNSEKTEENPQQMMIQIILWMH